MDQLYLRQPELLPSALQSLVAVAVVIGVPICVRVVGALNTSVPARVGWKQATAINPITTPAATKATDKRFLQVAFTTSPSCENIGRDVRSLHKTPPVWREARIITLAPAARAAPFCNPDHCPGPQSQTYFRETTDSAKSLDQA